jgi:hypothetical protein
LWFLLSWWLMGKSNLNGRVKKSITKKILKQFWDSRCNSKLISVISFTPYHNSRTGFYFYFIDRLNNTRVRKAIKSQSKSWHFYPKEEALIFTCTRMYARKFFWRKKVYLELSAFCLWAS